MNLKKIIDQSSDFEVTRDGVINNFVSDLDQCRSSLKVVSGEAHYQLFYELSNSFSNLKQNRVRIDCIIGPIITVDEITHSNALLEMAQEGLVILGQADRVF